MGRRMSPYLSGCDVQGKFYFLQDKVTACVAPFLPKGFKRHQQCDKEQSEDDDQ
jgi:hypothetical protein